MKSLRLLFLLACLLPGSVLATALNVVTSILPQQHFVERIGGQHVQVSVMVQPGQSPESYEPSPKQMAQLAGTDLYYLIGVPFEVVWMEKVLQQHPSMRVLDARDGITLRRTEAHPSHHHHDHHHGELDAHIWTSPPLVIRMAAAIRDTLSQLDPANAADFSRNHDSFVAELKALDAEIRQQLSQAGVKKFMVFHPSWGYFADHYGLEQIPIELEGKSPGPRSLAAVIERAKHLGIKTVFVQKQFSDQAARTVADAIGGSVIAIDPLALDYTENLRRVAAALSGDAN